MAKDPELDAMAAIKAALDPLDPDTRGHVLRWASQRFDVELPSQDSDTGESSGSGDGKGRSGNKASDYQEVADLVSAAGAQSDDERVLVVSYWFQVTKGQADVSSQPVNTELKNLGHGLKRINDVFAELVATRPQLMVQVRKSGKTAQARKVHKLTKAGTDRVEGMVAGTYTRASE
ncbi:MAG: hypothetical protein ACJ757_04840 [Gaiellaceae bacterium]